VLRHRERLADEHDMISAAIQTATDLGITPDRHTYATLRGLADDIAEADANIRRLAPDETEDT
jgi:hypothetical protein